ncbi:hypothetical protein H0H93_007330 [Arthromyces matolae]|nr:hypothetical protein H0H93_007330 [Arthromyces matolae]
MTYDKTVYNNDDEYFRDLAIAYRAEIMELYDLGCRNIQIDNPSFCFLCDEGMIASMEKAGQDPEVLLDSYIRATNMYTADRPDDLTIGVHMCRGNFRGKHFAEGSYARVAQKMFNELDVDVFYLEYDDVTRVGDFTPLKHLPRNKVAVLGLVTTKKAELETVEQLEAQVNQAVKAICEGSKDRTREEALNQLCISTQCGFASEWHGNPITEEDQQKKLELLVKAAKHIWRETDLHDSEVI